MTIESPSAPPGLRERKKRETARAIEVAAVELAAEQSLGEATIEAISARADVTSRTFFNYYASKEDAVLGVSRAFPRSQFLELTQRPGRSIVETLLDGVVQELGSIELGTTDFQAKKRHVLLENPHLLARDFQTMGDIEAELVAVTRRLLDEEGVVAPGERDDRAWAVVTLMGAVLRLAMQRWSRDSGSGAPVADHITIAFRTLRAVARDA